MPDAALKTANIVRTPIEGFDETAILDGLNEAQLRAVTHDKGPMLIIAGAGTGKTTVISRRVAWLIGSGRAKPEEVLALTFTDKAAGEMQERIDKLMPLGYLDLWVSTFHSFCQRILTDHGMAIGLPGDFTLLSQTDAYLTVRQDLDRFDLAYYKPLGNPTKFVQSLLTHFSRAKDEAIGPEEYRAYAAALTAEKLGIDDATVAEEELSRIRELSQAYGTYQDLLLEKGLFDMGDLQLYAIRLLKKRAAILAKLRRQFKYVVVDEFQDTNWAQYELVKMLVGTEGNITVVGDDDQSIYKFRGASISNILQFKRDFPASMETVLTQNYRSAQNILDLSYKFIRLNDPNRLEAQLETADGKGISKRLVSQTGEKGEIQHLHYATLEDEVNGVIERISDLRGADPSRAWSDFCILVRSNSAADDFSLALQRRGIPFQFLALKGLYAKPVIMDALAYFRLLDDYHESTAMYRTLISPPNGVNDADLVALLHDSKKRTESLFETCRRHREVAGLHDATHTAIDRLLAQIEDHAKVAREKSVSETLIKYLYDSGYMKLLTEQEDGRAREDLSYLKQFLDRIRRYETMHDDPNLRHFMEEYELEREAGDSGGLAFDIETGPDMVRIMTVHAAKGLEFPFVFVVNMVDKRFPTVKRGGDIEIPDELTKEIVPEGDIHLEEERRLFYVAMTRAKQGLYFSSAENYGGKTKKKLSRFIAELGFDAPSATPSVDTLTVTPHEEPRSAESAEWMVPDTFSFTQLAAYESCPLQYKYAHVFRIPVFGKPSLSFGKTVHAALEKFMTTIAERNAAAREKDPDMARPSALPVSREELMTMYDECWIDDWYRDKEEKAKYRKKGEEMLMTFYSRCEKEPPDPLFLEKEFKLKVGDRWIKGNIDRIDRIAGDTVEIIDYKTSELRSGKERPEKIPKDQKPQLLLYQIAVGRLMGLAPERLTYHYLDGDETRSFVGTEKELAEFEEDTEAKIAAILKGNFEPAPEKMKCTFCDFRNICDSSAA